MLEDHASEEDYIAVGENKPPLKKISGCLNTLQHQEKPL